MAASRDRRPSRSTRGVRTAELTGSDAENDEEFWNHDTWEDSSEDEGYSTEEAQPDVFDSDFNDSEDSSDSGDEDERRVRKNERETNLKATKVTYKEPAQKKKVIKRPAPAEKNTSSTTSTSSDTKRIRTRTELSLEKRSLRGSTVLLSKTSKESRNRLENSIPSKPKVPKVVYKFSQEALLTEAIETEKVNSKWILTAQRAALAKEQVNKVRKSALATIKMTSSRNQPTIITFTEVSTQPSFFRFTQAAPIPAMKKPGGRGVCAVSGKLAKYFDPVTQKPFADLAAFKQLRKTFASQQGEFRTIVQRNL